MCGDDSIKEETRGGGAGGAIPLCDDGSTKEETLGGGDGGTAPLEFARRWLVSRVDDVDILTVSPDGVCS